MYLIEKVSAFLFRMDPLRVRSEYRDEYDREARIIVDLLEDCETPIHLQMVIRETLAEHFGDQFVPKHEFFADMATVVWDLRHQAADGSEGSS